MTGVQTCALPIYCVGTSLRHGCKSLVQVEILPKPPAERAKDNPWPEWPKVYKMDYGQEEAAALWGASPDPHSLLVPMLVHAVYDAVAFLILVRGWKARQGRTAD